MFTTIPQSTTTKPTTTATSSTPRTNSQPRPSFLTTLLRTLSAVHA